MPATNPRISVTLKPSLDAMLKRMSDATGQSRSAIVGELLEQAEPVLARMVAVIEAARTATDEARGRLVANLADAQGKLEAHLGLAQDLFDESTSDLVGEAEQVGRRKSKGAQVATAAARTEEHSEGGGRGRRKASRADAGPPRLTGGSHPNVTGKVPRSKSPAKPSRVRKGA